MTGFLLFLLGVSVGGYITYWFLARLHASAMYVIAREFDLTPEDLVAIITADRVEEEMKR